MKFLSGPKYAHINPQAMSHQVDSHAEKNVLSYALHTSNLTLHSLLTKVLLIYKNSYILYYPKCIIRNLNLNKQSVQTESL